MKKKTLILGMFLFLLLVASGMAQEIEKVILVTNENYPDALVSSGVSEKLGIPVLVTEKEKIPEEVKETLRELTPREIILVGGPAVISEKVANELKEKYNVTRLFGITRYETAKEVADYFWPEGVEEAILVEDNLDEKEGEILGSAKDLAKGKPILLFPRGKIPAEILNQLNELGVRKVKLIATNLTPEMQEDLEGIGIKTEEKIIAKERKKLRQEIKKRKIERLKKNETLIVIAVANFTHLLTAPNLPQARSFLVSSEDEISEVIAVIKERDIKKVKVVGKPDLAKKIANRIEEETDAEVNLITKRAIKSFRQAALLVRENKLKFIQKFKINYQNWKNKTKAIREKLKEKANYSLQKLEELIKNANISEEFKGELLEELKKAREKFEEGKYLEAINKARKIRSKIKVKRWEKIKKNWKAIHEELKEEVGDLREKIQELRKIDQEFGELMRKNMSVKERLEVIKEFKEERKEIVRETIKEAKEIKKVKKEKVREWLVKIKRRIKSKNETEEEKDGKHNKIPEVEEGLEVAKRPTTVVTRPVTTTTVEKPGRHERP